MKCTYKNWNESNKNNEMKYNWIEGKNWKEGKKKTKGNDRYWYIPHFSMFAEMLESKVQYKCLIMPN